MEKHPESDTLYVSQIDFGEAGGLRTVVSGLANYISLDELKGRHVVGLLNLKPAKLRGIESKAMILCASQDEPKSVEPLIAPEGSEVGDRVFVEGYDNYPQVPEQLNPKKKIWEKLAADLKTSGDGVAQWQSNKMLTARGAVKAKSLTNVPVK